VGVFGLVLPILQGMSFLFLDSNACTSNPLVDDVPSTMNEQVYLQLLKTVYNSQCDWSWGMHLNYVSVVFWFLTGVALCGARRRKGEVSDEPEAKRKQSKDDEETGWFGF